MKTLKELKELNPCREALEWASQYSTLHEAWKNCERSDWMWWLLRRLNKCPKELSVTYSQWCADSVKHFKDVDDAADVAANVAAADAANAAKSAHAADYAAAYAADTYASDIAATVDAYADARKNQADYLRSIVSNPFTK
jgi:hypothetical protein